MQRPHHHGTPRLPDFVHDLFRVSAGRTLRTPQVVSSTIDKNHLKGQLSAIPPGAGIEAGGGEGRNTPEQRWRRREPSGPGLST